MPRAAYVYRNRKWFHKAIEWGLLLVDDRTGHIEQNPRADATEGWDIYDFIADYWIIGEGEYLVHLSAEVERLMAPRGGLLQRVLLSRIGEVIGRNEIPALRQEVETLAACCPPDRVGALENLLTKMRGLVEAAEREENPIVFT